MLVSTPLDSLQMCWWQRHLMFLRCQDNFKQFLATKTRILSQNSIFYSNQAFSFIFFRTFKNITVVLQKHSVLFCWLVACLLCMLPKIRKKEADQVMKTIKLTGFWPKCCSSVSKVTLIIHDIWRPNPIDMFYMQTLLICKVIREERSKKCSFPRVHTEKSCKLQMQNLFTCIVLIQLITVKISVIIRGEPALH